MKNLEHFNTNHLPPVLHVFLLTSSWGYGSIVLSFIL